MMADRKALTYDLDKECETKLFNLVSQFTCSSEKQVNVKVREGYIKLNVKLNVCFTNYRTLVYKTEKDPRREGPSTRAYQSTYVKQSL